MVTFKHVKRRQLLNEDVFEASLLCFFIFSFIRCYDEYLLWFFFTFCWSLNLLMSFFQIANLSLCVARVRVCVLPLNIEVSQAIIGTFFQCLFQKMIGWVPLEVLFTLCWSLNRLKCDGQCLFLSSAEFYSFSLSGRLRALDLTMCRNSLYTMNWQLRVATLYIPWIDNYVYDVGMASIIWLMSCTYFRAQFFGVFCVNAENFKSKCLSILTIWG